MDFLDEPAIEVSVVIPCLNEADTLEACINKAKQGLQKSGANGEIIVADNGSTDSSVKIASALGIRTIHITQKGYGSALLGAIREARGKWVVMADADESSDFGELPKFISKLREGYDLVMGCRLPSGGGRISPGAMPFLHRWIGNPFFSFLTRSWFKIPIHDVHCGVRGFSKKFVEDLDLRCLGMEFASEMVIKAGLSSGKITEVPVTLYPDQRVNHGPHLRTFRDGWRHLRFYLLWCPLWLFVIPGLTTILLGAICYALGFFGVRLFGITLDVHTMIAAGLMLIIGQQILLFGYFAQSFLITERFIPDTHTSFVGDIFKFNLEKGLILGLVCNLLGFALLLSALWHWDNAGFGNLDYSRKMRLVVPGTTFIAIGMQTIFASFFFSIQCLERSR